MRALVKVFPKKSRFDYGVMRIVEYDDSEMLDVGDTFAIHGAGDFRIIERVSEKPERADIEFHVLATAEQLRQLGSMGWERFKLSEHQVA